MTTMANNERTLEEVVGRNLRGIRAQLELSQDEIAASARRVGLPWSRSSVTAVEAGTKTLDLGEVVLASLALAVSVADLLAGGGSVRLSERSSISLPVLRAVLAGKELPPGQHALKVLPESNRELAATAAAGEAEQKAARKIGVDAQVLTAAAIRLWGHSLTVERDARLGNVGSKSTRSIQALRGRVTRNLLEELEPALNPKGAKG